MIQLDIEWGRANRGRVWHLLSQGAGEKDVAFCEVEAKMREVTRGLPPRGATPCPRCCEVVEALTFNVLQAQQQREVTSPQTETSETLDTSPDIP